MTKIVAIGAGSLVFGVELLRDIYQTPELRGAELWIVDLDPAAASRMGGLAEKLNEASGWDVTLRTTTERVEALPGADFVITSIAVARDSTWEADHKLALKHGFPSVLSENGGPGGLSHTLRSIPLMLAKDYSFPANYPLAVGERPQLRAGAQTLRGYALAPRSGVRRVDMRVNGGPWQEARIIDPQVNPYAWVRFEAAVDMMAGDHVIETRTTAANGDVQTPTVPFNAGGYDCWAIPQFKVRFA